MGEAGSLSGEEGCGRRERRIASSSGSRVASKTREREERAEANRALQRLAHVRREGAAVSGEGAR